MIAEPPPAPPAPPLTPLRAKDATLRDAFAMSALQGLLAATVNDDKVRDLADGIIAGRPYCKAAYAIADTMLELKAEESRKVTNPASGASLFYPAEDPNLP